MSWSKTASGISKGLGWILGLIALALVVWQAWTRQDQWLPLWRQLGALDLLAVLLLCLSMQVLFGLGWHVFARGRFVAEHILGDQLRWGQSLLAKYLPGKIWQGVARGMLYADERGVGDTFALFVREQLLSLGISALIAAVAAPAALPADLRLMFQLAFVAFAVVLTAIAVWACVPDFIASRLPRSLAGWNAARPAMATIAKVWLLQFAGYLAMCAAFAVLVNGFGLRLGWLQLAAALCFAGLAGVAAILVPAGLGVREAGLFWCLSPLIGAGNAAMLALAWRVAITFAEAAFAAISFAWGAWRR
ncbi:lysylphosphatidylglycerol synthase domain-containing protein [Lysobacter sp. TAB13]|uniref:lysylphosphatidylglycerol synthase domain-containing protein n=1 Tax=Lysobacter sp. TAB13 TaxID=3233065 RepID=UPI003F98FCE6